MKKIIAFYNWMDQLCWEIGWTFRLLLLGRIDGVIEMIGWVRIHLSYSGQMIGCRKLTIKQKVRNFAVSLLGFVIICFFVFVLFQIFSKMISYVVTN